MYIFFICLKMKNNSIRVDDRWGDGEVARHSSRLVWTLPYSAFCHRSRRTFSSPHRLDGPHCSAHPSCSRLASWTADWTCFSALSCQCSRCHPSHRWWRRSWVVRLVCLWIWCWRRAGTRWTQCSPSCRCRRRWTRTRHTFPLWLRLAPALCRAWQTVSCLVGQSDNPLFIWFKIII